MTEEEWDQFFLGRGLVTSFPQADRGGQIQQFLEFSTLSVPDIDNYQTPILQKNIPGCFKWEMVMK